MDMISVLLKKFNDNQVRYVHWKSNTNIDDALSGKDDFDVLIDPANKELVESFFANLSIIRAFSDKDTWQNDIYHYIGFDSSNCKLVHVHAHYALPVGYDFDKNFRLPVVNSYLDNPIKYKNVLIPEVEKEYIVLVLRLILKNALTPFLLHLPTRQLKLIRSSAQKGVVQGGGYKEFLDLAERSNSDRVKELLATEFNFVSTDLFNDCVKVLEKNNSISDYFTLGKRLKSQLKHYRNNSEAKSFLLSFLRINKGRLQKIHTKITGKNKYKKLPSNGGKIIAFVGGDGAGKSTNVDKLKNKLARHFWVEIVHVGRPPKSLLGFAWKLASKFIALLGKVEHAKALFYVSWALDRQAAFNYACKVRSQGGLVVLDRIPLPGITSMDCPRVGSVAQGRFKWLQQFEKNIYKKIVGVDLLFVLKLDPEVALKRRPEDDQDELRIRSGQIWNNDWHAPYAIEINTGENSFEEVEQEIHSHVGRLLATPFIHTEVLGHAGSGKSTLMSSISEKMPNIAHVMPFYQYPIQSFVGVGKGFWSSIKILNSTKNIQALKNSLQFFASIEIMKYWLKHGDSSAVNYILDQGPMFQLTLLLEEGVIDSMAANKYIKIIESLYGQCFFIDVNSDVLWQRVQARTNHAGRGQKCSSQAEFNDFVSHRKAAFDKVFTMSGSIINLPSDNLDKLELNQLFQEKLNHGR